MDRISVDELNRLMNEGPKPTVIDACSRASRARDGVIPGAIAFETLNMDVVHETLPPHLEVVIYCACPNEASAARIAKRLHRLGFGRVRPLEGGIHAWQDAGYSTERR